MGNKPGAIGLKRATYPAQSDWCQQQTRLNLIGASNTLSAIWLVLVTYPAQTDWFGKAIWKLEIFHTNGGLFRSLICWSWTLTWAVSRSICCDKSLSLVISCSICCDWSLTWRWVVSRLRRAKFKCCSMCVSKWALVFDLGNCVNEKKCGIKDNSCNTSY